MKTKDIRDKVYLEIEDFIFSTKKDTVNLVVKNILIKLEEYLVGAEKGLYCSNEELYHIQNCIEIVKRFRK